MTAVDDLLESLPDWKAFPTIDEIEAATDEMAEWPGVRVWTPGHSGEGHPIRCVEMGQGSRRALLIGFPHPEEPVGALTLDHLLRSRATVRLCAELDVRLSVIRVADLDAARLNESWFSTPLDLESFFTGVYRPPVLEQVEWTFPCSYRDYSFQTPPPQTQAVIAAMQSGPLHFVSSLHNAHFGGAFFYVSHASRRLLARLQDLIADSSVPLHRGEPEVPFVPEIADGVFREVGVADEYEYYVRSGMDPLAHLVGGTGHSGYACSLWPGCRTLMSEIPGFVSDLNGNLSPAGISNGEAQRRGIALLRGHVEWLTARLRELGDALPIQSPWLRTVREYVAITPGQLDAHEAWLAADPSAHKEATVAQAADYGLLRELSALFKLGQFARALEAQGGRDAAAKRVEAAARERLRSRLTVIASETGLRPVELRERAYLQLAAILEGLKEAVGQDAAAR